MIRFVMGICPNPPWVHALSPKDLNVVGPAGGRRQQDRDGMPAVAFKKAGGAVIPRDNEDIGSKVHDPRDDPVERLEGSDLGIEIAVLAGAVRLLEMAEKEVEIPPL